MTVSASAQGAIIAQNPQLARLTDSVERRQPHIDSLKHRSTEGVETSRFDDSIVNIQRPIGVVVESPVDEIMDAQAGGSSAPMVTGETATRSRRSSPAQER